eukprot:jgi/Botrbrau1/7927/Bobra.9_2s0091.2
MLLLQCTSRGSIFSSVNAGRKICPSFRGLATNTVRSSYARFCRFCYPGRRFCVNFKCISTTVSPQTIQAVFALATLYHGVLIGWMLVAPRSKRTKKVASSNLIFVPIALAYGYLLFYSWQPDTFSLILPGSLKAGFSGGFKPQFMPSIAGISTLFSRILTAASLWVHILAINLFAARTVYMEGSVR